MPDTVLGSAGAAENKTIMVTVLRELRVSQEDMHFTNQYQSLMTSINVRYAQRAGSRWFGWEGWRGPLTLGKPGKASLRK